MAPGKDATMSDNAVPLAVIKAQLAALQQGQAGLRAELAGLHGDVRDLLRAYEARLRAVEVDQATTAARTEALDERVDGLQFTSRMWAAGNSISAFVAALLGLN